jgi:hypothetical protein
MCYDLKLSYEWFEKTDSNWKYKTFSISTLKNKIVFKLSKLTRLGIDRVYLNG